MRVQVADTTDSDDGLVMFKLPGKVPVVSHSLKWRRLCSVHPSPSH